MESFEFEAELWVWDARRLDTWTFVSLPAELSQEVFERRTGTSAGRLRVGAGRRDHRYDLMADVDLPGGGRSIRPAGQEGGAHEPKGLKLGDTARVRIELIDP